MTDLEVRVRVSLKERKKVGSGVVRFTRMGYLTNWHRTRGLQQDWHCVQVEVEVQVEHVLDHFTELVHTLHGHP